MKYFALLFLVAILTGCSNYATVKVYNLDTGNIDFVEVKEEFANLLLTEDSVFFNSNNSYLRPSESFQGIVIKEQSIAITVDTCNNPITGETMPSGTILPCKSSVNKTGDIVRVIPLEGDLYQVDTFGIRCVFVK